MTQNWVRDISRMHDYFGFYESVEGFDDDKLKKLLEFRLNFIKEEFDETLKAAKNEDAEEIVDGLIDICVVAIGTLDLFDVDSEKAWNEVFSCNIRKQRGIKEGRPNPLGMPDLMKPEGWRGPSHKGNTGKFR